MMNLPDQLQREQALDIKQSFIVQAPAGSGKTELLMQRYLSLLASIPKTPEQIIALTFTRKAATEMRNRIIQALISAQAKPPAEEHAQKTWLLAKAVLQRDQKEQWGLLQNPSRLRIQTLDALCARLTRQMPILTHFGMQPDISDDCNEIYRDAVYRVLESIDMQVPWADGLAELLLHLDNDINRAERLLIGMLEKREQWLPYLGLGSERENLRQSLEASLQEVIQDALADLLHHTPVDLKVEILAMARYASSQLAKANISTPLSACLDLNIFPHNALDQIDIWRGLGFLLCTQNQNWRKSVDKRCGFIASSECKDPAEKIHAKTMKERMVNLLERCATYPDWLTHWNILATIPPAHYTPVQWSLLEKLIPVLQVLAAHLQVVFQERAQVDHVEIAIRAVDALGDPMAPTDLALLFDQRIQHILIDEFQDTSALQLQLLERLTAGWQAGDGRTLFLVGDPMQSIYRFRKAEVGLFIRAWQQGINEISLTPLTLHANFRSRPIIVEWINTHFVNLFPPHADLQSGAVAFNPSIAIREAQTDAGVHCHAWFDDQSEQEVATIVNICRKGLETGSVAILVRSKSHLTTILPALQKATIPYRAVEIETLDKKPVVQDLLALTRAMHHLADRIAWLAILRAPWCGLTLTDLHHLLSKQTATTTVWEILNDKSRPTISIDGEKRLARIMLILQENFIERQRKHLANWMEEIWLVLGGPACLQNETELEDAKAYFKLLERLEHAGDIPDVYRLQNALQRLFANVNTKTAHAVEVMTIHKAKGLEFDTVILPNLHRAPRQDDPQLLMWMERPKRIGGSQLLLAPIKASQLTEDPLYDYLRTQEQKKNQHEVLRLLYVAATRAKQTLHLTAILKRDDYLENGVQNPPTSSLLGQLWSVIGYSFIESCKKSTRELDRCITMVKPQILLRRLSVDWQLPLKGQDDSFSTVLPSTLMIDKNSSEQQSVTGKVLHQLLYRIAEQGIHGWQNISIDEHKKLIRYLLQYQGLHKSMLDQQTDLLHSAITHTLQDPKGQWLLSETYHDAQNNRQISGIINNQCVSFTIDRSFTDNNGTHWIIDYMSTQAEAEIPIRELIKLKIEQQQSNLSIIQEILPRIDAKPIRFGFYFPFLKAWHQL